MASLQAPIASLKDAGSGVRAIVLAPTRELAHQIHNECLKLAIGRIWRVILFDKATANTLREKNVRDKVGKMNVSMIPECSIAQGVVDIIIGTPLRLVSAIQQGSLELNKYV